MAPSGKHNIPRKLGQVTQKLAKLESRACYQRSGRVLRSIICTDERSILGEVVSDYVRVD